MFRWIGVLLVAVTLGGCTIPKVPFDRAAAGHVKTIGIVTPAFPTGPSVELATSVGQSFGLIGALVDAAMLADRNARFGKVLEQQNFSAIDTYTRHLADRLTARGYAVKPIAIKRESAEFAASYPPHGETGVDAYLDTVVISYGYIAAGIASNTPYRPRFLVRARLANATDTAVLMEDAVIYNHVGPAAMQSQAVTLAPDAAHRFDTFDILLADPENAVRGLRTATEQSAEAISHLLK
ncbi:MAG: hypothetical protein JNK67_00235 [Alphaproteobacteria bacterium]|nr:hypothetical protein [Alphaproteobacteria bacterium]